MPPIQSKNGARDVRTDQHRVLLKGPRLILTQIPRNLFGKTDSNRSGLWPAAVSSPGRHGFFPKTIPPNYSSVGERTEASSKTLARVIPRMCGGFEGAHERRPASGSPRSCREDACALGPTSKLKLAIKGAQPAANHRALGNRAERARAAGATSKPFLLPSELDRACVVP